MAAFHQAIEAQLDGATVRCTDLVRFDFKSGEVRLWGGLGLIRDGNGEVWQGIGEMGRLSAVQAGPGQAIEELTLSLFGSTAILARIDSDTAETVGREVTRYLQFFDIRQVDEAGNAVDWAPLDPPLVDFVGTMGPPFVDRPKAEAGSKAAASRTVSVRALNAFINRKKPAFGFWSNTDQHARTGGTDNLFINISRMADAVANWPHGLS